MTQEWKIYFSMSEILFINKIPAVICQFDTFVRPCCCHCWFIIKTIKHSTLWGGMCLDHRWLTFCPSFSCRSGRVAGWVLWWQEVPSALEGRWSLPAASDWGWHWLLQSSRWVRRGEKTDWRSSSMTNCCFGLCFCVLAVILLDDESYSCC